MTLSQKPCTHCGKHLVALEADNAWEWLHCYGCGAIFYDRTGLPKSASTTDNVGTRTSNKVNYDVIDWRIKIGERCKQKREELGLTQVQLAAEVGIFHKTIGAVEIGRCGDGPRSVIMSYLGVE